jgi:D-arabinose 1-dehydrogenase-like Zn-dependent alcohol dehydrogenase
MKGCFDVAPRKFESAWVPTTTITDDVMLVRVEACGVCSSDMTAYKDSLSRR